MRVGKKVQLTDMHDALSLEFFLTNRCNMDSVFRLSLKRCRLMSLVATFHRLKRIALLRVSSQAMISTPRRVSMARTVMSSRLPIGVETRYRKCRKNAF